MVTPTPTLADYRLRAELYGPELVLEAAAHDLDERELAELRSYVKHLERTKRWHKGRWQDRRATGGRPCEECGLDLPHEARSDMKRHAHCRVRASRRSTTRGLVAKRYTDGASTTGAPVLEQTEVGA
jgi:hypothetical protein